MGLSLAAWLASLFVGPWAFLLVGLPPFVLSFAVTLFGQWAWLRCPRCKGNLAPLISWHGGRQVSQRLRYCPYCGGDLDEELPDKPVQARP
jgi:hypothetical protein